MPDEVSHYEERERLRAYADSVQEQLDHINESVARYTSGRTTLTAGLTVVQNRVRELDRLIREHEESNPELPFPATPDKDPHLMVMEDDG